ncbi:MAG TPA: ETEC_3214 domain-containing protein [Micromonosporaceae bacterium]|nr:ETEC_3214 domain-containing protein [Micromonosporaceae bacterium]
MAPLDDGFPARRRDRTVWGMCSRVPWIRRRITGRRLRRLRCGVRLGYVTRLVRHSAPLVRRHPRSRLVEYVYALPDVYVQVVVDDDRTVVWFAVSTRSPRFHPRLNYCPTELPDVELARTTFGDLDVPRKGVVASLGPPRAGYAESVYLGDAGSFQTYVFGTHDISREPPDFPAYFGGAGQPALGWFGAGALQSDDVHPYAGTTVTTYAVFGAYRPDQSIDGYWWRVPFVGRDTMAA